MSPQRGSTRRARAPVATAWLGALMALSGCATLGGNVKGSFSCTAPDGICAPSATIDDRALAMISGEAGDVVIPAGRYTAPAATPRAVRTTLAAPARRDSATAPRTREKVLRIVFQPYIDDRGRLHEASAVHAVVQSEWQAQALADATPIPDRSGAATAPTGPTLAEAIERDSAGGDVAALDPNLPDPAVVAAARARAVDPVATIKADVAAQLARQPRRHPMGVRPSTSPLRAEAITGSPPPAARPPVPNVASLASPAGVAAGSPRPAATSGQAALGSPHTPSAASIGVRRAEGESSASAPSLATRQGRETLERVKATSPYRAGGERLETTAREARSPSDASIKPMSGPAVRAATFPASVPEDD